MKVAIITSGYLPVPASKGGAVENIVENFIIENEIEKKVNFEIFSIYDENAENISKKYQYTNFNFIKPNKIVKALDKIIYFFFKNIPKKEKTMSYRYIIQRLYFLRKTSNNLKKNNYDRIILENHSTLFLALKWHKNYIKYKDKYYYHIHNEIKSFYGCENIIKNTKKILCVSNYIKKQVENFFGIQDSKNIVKLTNCINIDEFKEISEKEKISLKKKYNIEKDEKVILFAGRLSNEKGIRELLLAIRGIKNVPKFKLLVVGSFFFDTEVKNSFEEELRSIIKEIKDKVIFTGYVKHEDMYKIYGMSDIAALPSLWEDPAPLTIIEAMSSGLPIVTTDSGGIPEYAKNDCAYIIKRDENLIKNIKEKLEELLNSEAQRKKMSEISLKNAKELNLKNFYNNLLKDIDIDL